MAFRRAVSRVQQPESVEPERVEALVAQALAAEAGEEVEHSHQAEASRLLTDYAFRLLHNQLAEVRREAVSEHLAGMRPPAGFWTVFLAALLAAIVAGTLGLFLIARPGLLAQLSAMVGG